VTVGALSVTVKLVAMVKEAAVAYRFGTGDSLDAFVVAFLLPTLVINVIAGAVPSAFTPYMWRSAKPKGPPPRSASWRARPRCGHSKCWSWFSSLRVRFHLRWVF